MYKRHALAIGIISTGLCITSMILPAKGNAIEYKTLDKKKFYFLVEEPNTQLAAPIPAIKLLELQTHLVKVDTNIGTYSGVEVKQEFTTSVEETETVKQKFIFNKVLVKVNEFLNIRSEASAFSKLVGKLPKGAYAVILERGKEWTKLQSGSVIGYASNEYLYFDEEAVQQAEHAKAFKVTVAAGTVNIRSAPSLNGEILGKASLGDTFQQIYHLTTDEWAAIQYQEGKTAYLSKQFITETFDMKIAISQAEEEEERKAQELAKALEEAKKIKVTNTNRDPISLNDEDIFLLSVVVAMEAMSESYEGQLAVANVVVNRLLSGRWGDTLEDVIYAPYQFSGANSGRIEQYSKKVTASCKKAAVEALAGNNNIGGFMNFIMKGSADFSSYKEYYILGNHCFYKR